MLKIYKAYTLNISTLFLGFAIFNRYIDSYQREVKSLSDISQMRTLEQKINVGPFLIPALMSMTLASKYSERIIYRISDLATIANIDGLKVLTPEETRQIEFEAMRVLGFRVGGDSTTLSFIENALIKIDELHYLPSEIRNRILETSLYLIVLQMTSNSHC